MGQLSSPFLFFPFFFYFLLAKLREAILSFPLFSFFFLFSSPHKGKRSPWKEEANQRVMDTKKINHFLLFSYSFIICFLNYYLNIIP
jgi:hypothetical protein